MEPSSASDLPMIDRDNRIAETFSRERARLRDFIRRRVPDASEAEDIVQDVFFEFIEACRLPEPIEQVGAWLYRVARNRIVDRFRKRKPQSLRQPGDADDGEGELENAVASADADPETAYARSAIVEALSAALAELPAEQRSVFIAHELEGRSFAELAKESGVPLNTLLARKRYAVLHLRERLQAIYEDFNS